MALKGTHLSEETKQKLRLFNLGKHHSAKTKAKIKRLMTGRLHTWGYKISKAMKGRKLSPEQCRRLGNLRKGTHLSIETRRKISEGNRGHKMSLKQRKLLSDLRKKDGHRPINGKAEKSSRWKGGITPENLVIRNSDEYRKWRMAVYRRDRFACIECGAKGRKAGLVAHHVKFFSRSPELRFLLENGITLCKKHHEKIHAKVKNF